MKINREQLLTDLRMVQPGVSQREFLEQSSCFCFLQGTVMTFNDEICCRKKTDLDITGAVQADVLLEILEKIDDPELLVSESPGEIRFKGEQKAFAVVKDSEVLLPVEQVEEPGEWKPLPQEFSHSVELVKQCVSSDESKFVLTCIHITPEYIEACDNHQLMRCRMKTGVPEPILVRGSSIVEAVQYGIDHISVTESWVHFKNDQDLIFSCRRYVEKYPNLDPIISFTGAPVQLPKAIAKAAERAAVFASDQAGDPLIEVSIDGKEVRIRGEGVSGWYEEIGGVEYEGPEMRFLISPVLLCHIAENYDKAIITEGRLKVSGPDWEYVTVLGTKTEEE